MKRFILILFSLFLITAANAQITAVWSYQQKDNGDGTIDLIFNAEIEMPWYIYTTEVIKNGPLPTTFEFKNISGYEAVGKLKVTTVLLP